VWVITVQCMCIWGRTSSSPSEDDNREGNGGGEREERLMEGMVDAAVVRELVGVQECEAAAVARMYASVGLEKRGRGCGCCRATKTVRWWWAWA
jgi:hypothetical protein